MLSLIPLYYVPVASRFPGSSRRQSSSGKESNAGDSCGACGKAILSVDAGYAAQGKDGDTFSCGTGLP